MAVPLHPYHSCEDDHFALLAAAPAAAPVANAESYVLWLWSDAPVGFASAEPFVSAAGANSSALYAYWSAPRCDI